MEWAVFFSLCQKQSKAIDPTNSWRSEAGAVLLTPTGYRSLGHTHTYALFRAIDDVACVCWCREGMQQQTIVCSDTGCRTILDWVHMSGSSNSGMCEIEGFHFLEDITNEKKMFWLCQTMERILINLSHPGYNGSSKDFWKKNNLRE